MNTRPEDMRRRDFLKRIGGAAAAAALAMGEARPLRAGSATATIAGREPAPPATADSIVLLWLAGGMAHTETFDPKHYEPFTPGIESKRVLSTFPAIPTNVDGIRFTQGLEQMATVMDEGALIRTFTLPVVDKIVHSRHQYHWHTGYLPPLSVAAPHIGSVIARTLGPRNPDVPAFVDIGETLAEAGREASVIRTFLSSGFLGAEFGPFLVPRPEEAAKQLQSSVGPRRSDSRMRAFRELLSASPTGELASSYQQESMLRSMEQAYRLMNSPTAKVFDLADEPKASFDAYNTGPFGQGCLMARRLVEAGVRFVEVHSPYKPFGHWDTHENGHTETEKLKRLMDRPVARLIRDLRSRGLLDRTLVVLASEFSRDVLIEGKETKRARVGRAAIAPTMQDIRHYGMHAHFADAGSILLWGGGVTRGFAYGETADEHPCKAIRNPAGIEDVHATLYRAMGISPRQAYEVERRPFYATKDGLGKPIRELIA